MLRRTLFPIALTVLATVASGQSSNSTPLSADRPSFSDSSSLIGRGWWQIEGGSTYYQLPGNTATTLGEVTLRRQISDTVELRVVNLGLDFMEHGGSGLIDPGVGFKYRFLAGTETRPELTFEALTSVPLGATPFRTNAFQPSAKLLFTENLASNWAIGGSAVWTRVGSGDGAFDQLAASLYLTQNFSAKTQAFYEVYGFNTEGPELAGTAWADVGILQYLSNNLRLDLRVGSSSEESQYGWYVGAGLAVRF